MDEKKREELRDQARKYFALHADQRLKAFNFYLILCTVIAGGLLTLIKDARDPRIAIPVALLLPSLSLVFWKLDTRNRQLIAHSQEALMFFEDDPTLKTADGTPHVAQLFQFEKHFTGQKKPWTYRRCFNAVFLIVGIAGTATATALAWVR
jgi:hypothetical protein